MLIHSNRISAIYDVSVVLSQLKHQFTNLCKFTCLKFAVLKFTVKIAKATHLQTYANSQLSLSLKSTVSQIYDYCVNVK